MELPMNRVTFGEQTLSAVVVDVVANITTAPASKTTHTR